MVLTLAPPGPSKRRAALRGFAALCIAANHGAVLAQNADGSNVTQSISDRLPRPGYEPRNLRIGSATVAGQIGFETRYDSNLFAVSKNPISDFGFILTPDIAIDGAGRKFKYHAELFADIRRYAQETGENHESFGFDGSGSYAINDNNRIAAGTRIERLVESRNDPEANTNRNMPPRLVNSVAGDLSWGYLSGRFGLDIRTAARNLSYLAPEDAERSLANYSVAVRASLVATPLIAVFVQPYVNRRDFALAVDSTGVDRDMTTLGLVGGVKLTTTDRWTGEIGIGAFTADPDDATLESFSGFAASANVAWTPTQRTKITLRGASGDAATVRVGAIGRTDSTINLRIDQEVRHNLRFTATAGYQKTQYRGLPNNLRTGFASAQVEYLMNRVVSLFLTASYAERRADPPTDGFDRGYVGLGIRLRH